MVDHQGRSPVEQLLSLPQRFCAVGSTGLNRGFSWHSTPSHLLHETKTHVQKWTITHVFARDTHGSPLLHLASFHKYAHHYWVTGIENKLREYFHLTRKYCYMPKRTRKRHLEIFPEPFSICTCPQTWETFITLEEYSLNKTLLEQGSFLGWLNQPITGTPK